MERSVLQRSGALASSGEVKLNEVMEEDELKARNRKLLEICKEVVSSWQSVTLDQISVKIVTG